MEIDTVRKKVAIEIYSQVVKKTPVDTGRARGNWQIGVGVDETGELDRFGDNTPAEVGKLGGVKGDETIYISNNVPYIVGLEYGKSKQAPQGMVGTTMAGISQKIEKFIKEN